MEASNNQGLHLYSLPNEVFVQILSPLTTLELLPLATISQRFHALVLRLLHYRLLLSARLTEYKLILECFHPTSKLIEPHVFCTYLGTPGLSDKYEGEGSLYENIDTAQKLGRLGSLYSRFRPEDFPGEDFPAIKRPVNLEGFEEFSQLCVVVNVVKALPGTTHLISAVNVEDGVIRLFRGWLKGQANDLQSSPDHHTLWVGQSKNVGLKFRVQGVTRLDTSLPVLIRRDEESFLSYEIFVDELLVRTTRLLLTVEKSLQEQQHYPNAVVFGRTMA